MDNLVAVDLGSLPALEELTPRAESPTLCTQNRKPETEALNLTLFVHLRPSPALETSRKAGKRLKPREDAKASSTAPFERDCVSHPWEVVAGGMQSCARLVDGSLRCWGHRDLEEGTPLLTQWCRGPFLG